MTEKKSMLTGEGLKKLQDELQDLEVVQLKEVAQKIKEAREQGDLSENAEYDAAMDLSRTTLDAAERSEALHKAEDILMEEAGCIPVAYYNDFWLQSDKITGSWHSPYGYWFFMYADIAE